MNLQATFDLRTAQIESAKAIAADVGMALMWIRPGDRLWRRGVALLALHAHRRILDDHRMLGARQVDPSREDRLRYYRARASICV